MRTPDQQAIIARLYHEMEERERAELERAYAPKPSAEQLASAAKKRERQRTLADIQGKLRRSDSEVRLAPRGRADFGDGIETIWLEGMESRRMIQGIASTPRIVHEGTKNAASKDPWGCHVRLPIPLKCGHDAGAIGAVTLFRKSKQSIFIRASFFESRAADAAWALVKSGEFGSLSVGPASFDHIEAVVDGVQYVSRWTLKEVSICRRPANPDCHFEVYRDR